MTSSSAFQTNHVQLILGRDFISHFFLSHLQDKMETPNSRWTGAVSWSGKLRRISATLWRPCLRFGRLAVSSSCGGRSGSYSSAQPQYDWSVLSAGGSRCRIAETTSISTVSQCTRSGAAEFAILTGSWRAHHQSNCIADQFLPIQ